MTPTTALDTPVTAGVDTHAHTHMAAVLNPLGQILGTAPFPTTQAGYAQMAEWIGTFGEIGQVGIEGTGSYGAGLSRWLTSHDIAVVEVDRPDRKTRRRHGKSDTVDAIAAARAVQSDTATAIPKDGNGPVEAIRTLHLTRRSAIKARTQAANQLHALIITAPDTLRATLRPLSITQLVETAARFRPASPAATPKAATKRALKSLARRYQQLSTEIAELDRDLDVLTSTTAPRLISLKGVGTQVAAQLLITAGDNPQRMHNDAEFAHLCGAAPIQASSGQTTRHRLNRGGDRLANAALYRIVITRMASDPRTRAYVQRRTAQGKTKREIIRCLKRYVAREVFNTLQPETP